MHDWEKFNEAHAQPFDCNLPRQGVEDKGLYDAAHRQNKDFHIDATAETRATLQTTVAAPSADAAGAESTKYEALASAIRHLSATALAAIAILAGQWALVNGADQESLYLSAAGLVSLVGNFVK